MGTLHPFSALHMSTCIAGMTAGRSRSTRTGGKANGRWVCQWSGLELFWFKLAAVGSLAPVGERSGSARGERCKSKGVKLSSSMARFFHGSTALFWPRRQGANWTRDEVRMSQ